MIRVSVLYENSEGKKFDMAYYCDKHIPLVKEKLGSACKRVDVDQGLNGAQPGSKPPFVVMAHGLFDSMDALVESFLPHADLIVGDIPNYTDISPLIQVSEVKL